MVDIDRHGCWLWRGGKTHDGYGLFRIGGRDGVHRGAHCVAMALTLGPLPDGTVVMHADCDEPSCVRPDHLVLGTTADNNRDMVAKGRHARTHRRLERKEIRAIRKAVEAGESKSSIARRMGIGRCSVLNVALGKTFKGVR